MEAADPSRAPRHGRATPDELLLLAGPRLRPEQRFFFMQIELPHLDAGLVQGDAHGLLGQRALLAPRNDAGPMEGAARRVTVGNRGGVEKLREAREFGKQGEGAIEGVYTDYLRHALNDHVGGRFTRFDGTCATRLGS